MKKLLDSLEAAKWEAIIISEFDVAAKIRDLTDYVKTLIKAAEMREKFTVRVGPTTHTKDRQMIKPTVGRVVWYYPNGPIKETSLDQPLAASIAFVHSDTCINIGYLDIDGNHKNATSVKLLQEGDGVFDGAYCTWMPYQVGQAKKETAAYKDTEEGAKEGFRSLMEGSR